MTWPDEAYPTNRALGTSNWKLEEIERELRAQIERILVPELGNFMNIPV